MMTGSGSALFGLFETREEVARAILEVSRGEEEIFPFSLVSRSQYRAIWWRQLDAHLEDKRWPPRSRYAQ
jgi:hypothetical protein